MINVAIQQRLETLRAERAAGQKMLAEMDEKRAQLTSTMLRIDGAITVLEELVSQEEPAPVPVPSNGAAGEVVPAALA